MFRLLRLRPPHGWNAVAWELAIVTLGVLIALAAQQILADIHDCEAVTQLRRALRAELADDRARWEDMRASDPCTLQRLEVLTAWATETPARAKLVRPFVLRLWNMHSSSCDIAKASAARASRVRQLGGPAVCRSDEYLYRFADSVASSGEESS